MIETITCCISNVICLYCTVMLRNLYPVMDTGLRCYMTVPLTFTIFQSKRDSRLLLSIWITLLQNSTTRCTAISNLLVWPISLKLSLSVFVRVIWSRLKANSPNYNKFHWFWNIKTSLKLLPIAPCFFPLCFWSTCFISGLSPDIKMVGLIHQPIKLNDAIRLAYLHEQHLVLERNSGCLSLALDYPVRNPQPC